MVVAVQETVKMCTRSTAQITKNGACVLTLNTWTMSRRSASPLAASAVSGMFYRFFLFDKLESM